MIRATFIAFFAALAVAAAPVLGYCSGGMPGRQRRRGRELRAPAAEVRDGPALAPRGPGALRLSPGPHGRQPPARPKTRCVTACLSSPAPRARSRSASSCGPGSTRIDISGESHATRAPAAARPRRRAASPCAVPNARRPSRPASPPSGAVATGEADQRCRHAAQQPVGRYRLAQRTGS